MADKKHLDIEPIVGNNEILGQVNLALHDVDDGVNKVEVAFLEKGTLCDDVFAKKLRDV